MSYWPQIFVDGVTNGTWSISNKIILTHRRTNEGIKGNNYQKKKKKCIKGKKMVHEEEKYK